MCKKTDRFIRILAAFAVLGAIVACGGSDDESEPAEGEANARAQIGEVVFARGIDDSGNIVGGPVPAFRADESTVHARIAIRGRTRPGTIQMRWMWRDIQLATFDVAVNEETTFITGTATAPQLYIGDGHHLDLLQDGTALGSYPFRVVPPEGARPSRFVSAGLYRSFDEATGPQGPTTSYQPGDPIVVAGRVALGNESWFDARFTLNGTVDNSLTWELIGGPDGGEEAGFHVERPPPAGGWPPGSHRVELILDDRTVAAYDFTVAPPS